jgi:hypothetical protein
VVLAGTAILLPVVGREWRSRGYAVAMAVALAAAVPWLTIWPLLLYQQSPELFRSWLWDENLKSYFGALDRAGTLFYLQILPWYAFPVWLLAAWTLWHARLKRGLTEPVILLPMTGFVLTLAALSASSDARELYALPLLLPLSLLAVPAPETLRRGAVNAWYWFSAMTFTFFVVVFWFYWSGLELAIPLKLHQHLHRIRPGYAFGFRWLPFLLGIAYSLAWLGVLASFRRSPMRPVITWGAGITVMWALLAILFVGWADNAKSYRGMVASMQRAMPKRYDCMSSRELSEAPRAMLYYFAGIITHREEVPARRRACELMLMQGVSQGEVVLGAGWKKIWEGARPGDKDERYRLYYRPRK